jgi:CRISPR-associated protein Cas2
MMVLILERVSPSVRGDLSRWLVEVGTGVFVGRVSQIVREALWDRCLQRAGKGSALMVWRTNNEQGFDLRAYQPKGRIPVNVEGVWLAQLVSEAEKASKP